MKFNPNTATPEELADYVRAGIMRRIMAEYLPFQNVGGFVIDGMEDGWLGFTEGFKSGRDIAYSLHLSVVATEIKPADEGESNDADQ